MIKKIGYSKYWYYTPEYFRLGEDEGLYCMKEIINSRFKHLKGPFRYTNLELMMVPPNAFVLFSDGKNIIAPVNDGVLDAAESYFNYSDEEPFYDKNTFNEDVKDELGVDVLEAHIAGETNRHIGPYGTVFLVTKWSGDFNCEVSKVPIDQLDTVEVGERMKNIICDPQVICWTNILFHVFGKIPPV